MRFRTHLEWLRFWFQVLLKAKKWQPRAISHLTWSYSSLFCFCHFFSQRVEMYWKYNPTQSLQCLSLQLTACTVALRRLFLPQSVSISGSRVLSSSEMTQQLQNCSAINSSEGSIFVSWEFSFSEEQRGVELPGVPEVVWWRQWRTSSLYSHKRKTKLVTVSKKEHFYDMHVPDIEPVLPILTQPSRLSIAKLIKTTFKAGFRTRKTQFIIIVSRQQRECCPRKQVLWFYALESLNNSFCIVALMPTWRHHSNLLEPQHRSPISYWWGVKSFSINRAAIRACRSRGGKSNVAKR